MTANNKSELRLSDDIEQRKKDLKRIIYILEELSIDNPCRSVQCNKCIFDFHYKKRYNIKSKCIEHGKRYEVAKQLLSLYDPIEVFEYKIERSIKQDSNPNG